jgi:hypothetical protein
MTSPQAVAVFDGRALTRSLRPFLEISLADQAGIKRLGTEYTYRFK